MKFKKPKISVIIPTYNSAKTIKKTLLSIFLQSFKNFEIIIVDSFSSDGTLQLIKTFKDSRIKIFYCPKFRGLSFARYYGALMSKGEYLSFLDSDDIWDYKKLAEQFNFMKLKNSNFSCTKYHLIGKKFLKKEVNNSISKFNFNFLLVNRPIATSSVMVKRKNIIKMRKKFLKKGYAEDFLMWLGLLKKIKYCHYLNKDYVGIYLSTESRSFHFFKNYKALFEIYKNYFDLKLTSIVVIYILLIYKNFNKVFFKLKNYYL